MDLYRLIFLNEAFISIIQKSRKHMRTDLLNKLIIFLASLCTPSIYSKWSIVLFYEPK